MKKYPFAGVMVLVANEAQAATLNFVGHPLLERSGTNILGRVYDLEVLYGVVLLLSTLMMVTLSVIINL
jgi:hypothetical protein